VIAAAFYTVGQVLARLGRENPPLTPAGHASVAAVMVLMGGTWLYCRRGPRSQKALRALDALLLLALGVLVLRFLDRRRSAVLVAIEGSRPHGGAQPRGPAERHHRLSPGPGPDGGLLSDARRPEGEV
jgi:hypothetical protein